jgi:DNA-binding CsgD family transcriptional regulator
MEWHRLMAQLVDGLDRPNFWHVLTSALGDYVRFDSYLCVQFSGNETPTVFAANMIEEDDSDLRLRDYVGGLFLLDPFYTHFRSTGRGGLFRLDEVAPDAFKRTDYYKRYFRWNVVEDEVQFMQVTDKESAMCLSLGSKNRFRPAELATLAMITPWVTALMRQRLIYENPVATAGTVPHTPESWKVKFKEAMQGEKSAKLTARELEISHLILSGFSAKSIASKLSISAETVKVHKKHLYAKLGVESQSELFSMFLQSQYS